MKTTHCRKTLETTLKTEDGETFLTKTGNLETLKEIKDYFNYINVYNFHAINKSYREIGIWENIYKTDLKVNLDFLSGKI